MLGFTACEDVPAPYKLYTEGGNSETIFSETFASSLGKFANYTTDGGVSWVNSYSCATATGYDNATKVTTDGTAYLISQTIDLTNIDTLLHITYDYVLRYNRSKEYQALLITEDFVPNLGNVEEQPWKTLFNDHTEGVDYNTFYQADVNVPEEFIGKKVRIAFYFKCETSSSTWEVKNFKVLKGAAGQGGDGTEDEDAIFNAVFSSSLLPFTNYTTSGEGEWINDYSTAKATGYDNESKVTTAGTYYLVSPAISLANVDSAYVDYSYILRYNKGAENQQLLISSSFDPNNPTAGWKVLNNNHTEGTDWATFAETEIQIPEEFIGQTIYLAFYYNTDNKSGSTWEVKSIAVRKGVAGEGGDDTTISGGTKDNPFSVAELQALFDANKIPSQKIYVHGIVSQIKEVDTGSYGNATYYISDDGSTSGQFEIYRGYSLNGAKFTSKDQLQEGDEVIVYGTAVLYNGKTREITQGSQIYYSSRLGKADDSGDDGGTTGGTPKGSGTANDPYNVAKLLQLFSSNNIPSNEIYFKGIVAKIKEVDTGQYGNATYYVSDDGKDNNTFYVYRSKYLNNTKFTSENQLQVGDTVIVYGKVTLYINTPETEQNNSYLYWTSRTGGQGDDGGNDDGGDNDDDKPVVSSIENGGFETWVDGKTPENWKTASSAGNATLSQSTDAHSGTFSVCVAGTTSANKRLGYKEINLEAGTYTMTFYAKAESATASVRPGYVPVKSDGSVGSYVYGEYTNDISANEWVKVTHEFTIDSNTTLCLVIMNSKNPGGNVLIDDVTLTKSSSAKKRH